MPVLSTHPPEFTPGKRYTQERKDAIKLNQDGFLWPEEEKLFHHIIREHEMGFTWNEMEKGLLSCEYFDPVVFLTIEHIPWSLKNIPIPPGIYDKVIAVLKDKINSGIYEPSSSSYRSRWFCVLKKDGKSLRVVHDLQPLNAVTIKDAGIPPMVEQYAESFGGRGCYAMFDIFVGYDQRELSVKSRDLTTFQTPLGTFRLTSVPMGYTNAVQLYHGDITFLLQDEIPDIAIPFIDDVPVKGPPMRYKTDDGGYETIPENNGIRRFVWEHAINMNRVVQRIRHAGGAFSALKSEFCVLSTIVVGHKCTYQGREVDEKRIQKIVDWPICRNLTEVRGFLGTMGVIRIFIENYAMHARPLVNLTKKEAEFEFGAEELYAMEKMKKLAENCPAIRALDYTSGNEVILLVDSSWMAVGFILSQLGDDGKRYPSRFGSITWNEREQRYSQAKIELYGLFRVLRAMKMWIIGVKKLVVEVDAKYIKGMINNPDVQPNAAMNRWIAAILLFDFELRHIPGKDHGPADSLSRRPKAPEDTDDEDDSEEWIDRANGFKMEVLNYQVPPTMVDSPKYAKVDPIYERPKEYRTTERPSVLVMSVMGPDLAIPRHEKAEEKDRELEEIKLFLETMESPADLTERQLERFTWKASDFFVREGRLWKKDRTGKHKRVIERSRRLALLMEAHDEQGHKGIFSVHLKLLERFWWPHLEQDVKWYIRTCHECQIRSVKRFHIPPTVPIPAPLFCKVYIDTMLMPKAQGFRYIIHARCSMSSYPEWDKLRRETERTIVAFIYTHIICRWGALIELFVSDNAPMYLKALEILAAKYNFKHIKITPYNSQAQGPIE